LPLGSPGVWTVTVRFGATPIGSKTVLLTDGTGPSTGDSTQPTITASLPPPVTG
jgi:hypothetical protein